MCARYIRAYHLFNRHMCFTETYAQVKQPMETAIATVLRFSPDEIQLVRQVLRVIECVCVCVRAGGRGSGAICECLLFIPPPTVFIVELDSERGRTCRHEPDGGRDVVDLHGLMSSV